MSRFVLLCAVACAALASHSAAQGGAVARWNATPGTRHYRYTSVERTNGQPDKRYRVEFDLVTGADHGVAAVIRDAQSAAGDVWSTPSVTEACTRALHGRGRELARVTLSPLSPEAAASLGEAFMAMCAPAEYFFPMTDILNVSLIQTQPKFHLADLTAVGMKARFDGFATKLDRLGVSIVASSPGGEITLNKRDARGVTIDWEPDPMPLSILHHGGEGAPDITLRGVEHYAFRLEIDPASGVLRRATTTVDTLELVVDVPGIPADKAPHLVITREVTIERRD
jgi:hypothetical protein